MGLLSQSDKENIQDQFDEQRLKIEGLSLIANKQVALAYVTLSLLVHDKLLQSLKQLAEEDYRALLTTQGRFAENAAAMRRLQAIIAQIHSEVKSFLTAYYFAELDGKLSPTFSDSTTLADLLSRLSKTLPLGTQLPLEPKPNNMEFYYRTARVAPVITNTTLALHIHLPLVFTTRKFKLYEITSFPVQMNNTDIFMFHKLPFKYIAVDEVQMNHLLLTDSDLSECHETTEAPICNPSVPVQIREVFHSRQSLECVTIDSSIVWSETLKMQFSVHSNCLRLAKYQEYVQLKGYRLDVVGGS